MVVSWRNWRFLIFFIIICCSYIIFPKEILIKLILGVESPIDCVEVQDIINGFNSINLDITTADLEATLELGAEENSEYQAELMEEADELL